MPSLTGSQDQGERGATAAASAAAPASALIPRTFHYVWVGPNPLPDQDRAFIEGWQRLHPGWQVRAWTDATIDYAASDWLKRAYAMRAWNRVSNFVRMDVLRRFGGVYLDTDVELLRPLDPLLGDGCFIGYQSHEFLPQWTNGPHWVNGAVIGSVAGHWFPDGVLRHVTTSVGGEQAGAGLTGPGAVTHVLLEAGLPEPDGSIVRLRDMTIYPRQYFYPYGQDETLDPSMIAPETYAVHHWAATWVKDYASWPLSKKLRMRLARHLPGLVFWWTQRAIAQQRRRQAGQG